jgi:hypothetical protein
MASKAFPRIVIALLLLASTLPLLAANNPQLADAWRAGLKEVDQKLRAQKWESAAKQARKLAYAIADTAGTGEGASYSLAVASVFRAIAEGGMGNMEDAAWHWDTALNLFPDIAKTKVDDYGPVAAELRKRTLREPEPDEVLNQALKLAGQKGPISVDLSKNITPPRIVKQPRPEFPVALGLMSVDGQVVVSTIIGSAGRPREPRVLTLKNGGPAMKYAALDSLRQGRFEPAKLNGEPVAVYYVLTLNFKIKGKS